MLSGDIIRGYSDTIILCILMEEDSYGYEISKEITRRTNGQYTMKETTLYSVFNRLEKNGYLSSYYGEETFGRRRTYYKITSSGIDYYYNKCLEWQDTKGLIEIFTKQLPDQNQSEEKKRRKGNE